MTNLLTNWLETIVGAICEDQPDFIGAKIAIRRDRAIMAWGKHVIGAPIDEPEPPGARWFMFPNVLTTPEKFPQAVVVVARHCGIY